MPESIQGSQDARWARLDALFDAGLDVAPEQRAAWLTEQCAGDVELHSEVLDLIEKAAAPTEILAPEAFAGGPLMRRILAGSPGEGPAESLGGEPVPGTRIGAWRVLGRLGQGGMGTVHRVERADGAFDQVAALKLIKPGGWSDFGRRLESERQILANLNHPNIARLLDGGYATDGRPYLVMEWVDGRPIDRYCDHQRLSIDQRLEIFGQVCQAVQHAHRALVVHRDLKPSNVMVDAEGQVTLLDFGIARALTPAGTPAEPLTQAVDRVMTPDYASPEQVLGQAITTASDVYQLGLLLFELLTGQRAQRVDSPSPAALVSAVSETAISRPSTVAAALEPETAQARSTTPQALSRRLAGDLDSIVASALRKRPEQRYRSVAELHDDIERHQRGLPVRARPDNLGYRLRLFVGRHRQAAAWVTLSLTLIFWLVLAAARDRVRTLREAERVRQIESVIGSLFEYPRVSDAGRPPQMSDFVDHAATLIRQKLSGQPASQTRLLARLGRTRTALGDYRESVALYREALSLVPSQDLEQRADLRHQLGLNQHYLGLFDAAETSLREAARLHGEIFGDDAPQAVAVKLELADLLHSRGWLREAQALIEPAIASLGHAGQSRGLLELRARAWGYLGNVLRDRGAYAPAEDAYRSAIALALELHGLGHGPTASNSINLGRLLVLRGRLDEAEARLRGELTRLRRVHFGEHPLTATALRELAFAAIERGQLEVASTRLESALAISAQRLDAEHPTIPRIRAIQAELARRRGNLAEAIEVSKATLDHFARLGLSGHPSAIDTCITLGLTIRELNATAEPWATTRLVDCRAAAERELVAGDRRTRRLRQF